MTSDRGLFHGLSRVREGLGDRPEARLDDRRLVAFPAVVEPEGRGKGTDPVPGLEEVGDIGLIGHACLEGPELPGQRGLHVPAAAGEDLCHPHPAVDQNPRIGRPEPAASVQKRGLVVSIRAKIKGLRRPGFNGGGLSVGRAEIEFHVVDVSEKTVKYLRGPDLSQGVCDQLAEPGVAAW